MDDVPLDDLRPRLVAAMLPHVPFDGWTRTALATGARDAGIDADVAALAFPGGALDMVDAFIQAADADMVAALDTPAFRELKVRERVTLAIRTRLEQADPHREAVRRAVNGLAAHPVRAARTSWRTADGIWRLCGDTATDLNWYSKRALAAGVYAATLAYWLGDESPGRVDTWAFLDRRIADVMRVGGALNRRPADGFSVARFLGRLRYPAR